MVVVRFAMMDDEMAKVQYVLGSRFLMPTHGYLELSLQLTCGQHMHFNHFGIHSKRREVDIVEALWLCRDCRRRCFPSNNDSPSVKLHQPPALAVATALLGGPGMLRIVTSSRGWLDSSQVSLPRLSISHCCASDSSVTTSSKPVRKQKLISSRASSISLTPPTLANFSWA